ncbi:hypothetical protein GCM10023224_51200 [Streptomonospora halophila]|uniref:Uncharacterized protein n=1 Tax=Streptomonospora halophila TaxID=427369 RepID=A0ABP9H188_9ACTN
MRVPAVRRAIANHRESGWKDWHLLHALANSVVNARLSAKYGAPTWKSTGSFGEYFFGELNRAEEQGDPSASASEVTRESLQTALKTTAASTLATWGWNSIGEALIRTRFFSY